MQQLECPQLVGLNLLATATRTMINFCSNPEEYDIMLNICIARYYVFRKWWWRWWWWWMMDE